MADGLVRLDACDPASGLPYAATATVFASHAWKYEFEELVSALGRLATQQAVCAGLEGELSQARDELMQLRARAACGGGALLGGRAGAAARVVGSLAEDARARRGSVGVQTRPRARV